LSLEGASQSLQAIMGHCSSLCAK